MNTNKIMSLLEVKKIYYYFEYGDIYFNVK